MEQASLFRTELNPVTSDLVSARQPTLTSTDPAPRDVTPAWSNRVGDRLCAGIEPSLANWLDEEIWKEAGAGEFHHAVSPDTLLCEQPDVIWPGLMLPDTLPLLGNRYGDWLCLRVGADNTISEVIHWYHGGGDWIPWGRTLAEAILFDTVRDRLPGRRQAHAIEAESQKVESISNPYFRWAQQFITSDINANSGIDIDRMLEHGYCEVALRCELALNALDSSLRQKMTPALAGELGAVWEPDVVSWLFDNRLIPESKCAALLSHCQAGVGQDWEATAAHARIIASERDDLVWAFDLAGWGDEQVGDLELAAGHYQRGTLACAFADQSIRFRSHWFPQWAGKFSTWRLCQLLDNGKVDNSFLQPMVSNYLQAIRPSDSASLRSKAMKFWRETAVDAVREGRWSDAYDAFYRAGWDLGTDTMIDFGDMLKGLVESAKRAGQHARAAVAEIHLQAFVSRFG